MKYLSKHALMLIWDASTPDRTPQKRLLGFLPSQTSDDRLLWVLRSLYNAIFPQTASTMIQFKAHNGKSLPKLTKIAPLGVTFGDNPWIAAFHAYNISVKRINDTLQIVQWNSGYRPLQMRDIERTENEDRYKLAYKVS